MIENITLQDFIKKDFQAQGIYNKESLENASIDSLNFIKKDAYEEWLKEWKYDEIVATCFKNYCGQYAVDSVDFAEKEFWNNLTIDKAITIAESDETNPYYNEMRDLTLRVVNTAYQNCCALLLEQIEMNEADCLNDEYKEFIDNKKKEFYAKFNNIYEEEENKISNEDYKKNIDYAESRIKSKIALRVQNEIFDNQKEVSIKHIIESLNNDNSELCAIYVELQLKKIKKMLSQDVLNGEFLKNKQTIHKRR